MNHHAKNFKEVLAEFKVDKEKGLTQKEVEKRLVKFGMNKLKEEKPPSFFIVLLRQFKDLFTIILLAAALVSLFFGEKTDALIIFIALLLNIVVSVIQETRALKTISELKEVIVYRAKVLRNGKVKQIDAKQVVPGDIVYLDAGDRVPADARLFDATRFETKEALLTGEANPVKKNEREVLKAKAVLGDRVNMVYQSTVVLNGKAEAVVVATGHQTEMGKVAKMVSEAKEEATPLQKKMRQLSIWLSVVALGSCAVIMVTGVILGKGLMEMFEFAVALAISSIPEGMVLSVTIVLAVGTRQILKRKAVARELVAAETLGSTTVICSDKTGTMTTGSMVVEKVITPDGEFHIKDLNKEKVLSSRALTYSMLVSALCNDLIIENPGRAAKKVLGDTTEKALYEAALKTDFNKSELLKDYPLLDEIPFDSYIKYMVSLHEDKKRGKKLILVKGTAERLLNLATKILKQEQVTSLTEAEKKNILKENDVLSFKGYRVITLGYKEVSEANFDLDTDHGQDLVFLSFVAIRDPLRKNIKKAIKLCLAAGIKIKMITGDHKLTAKHIAEEVGLKVKKAEEMIDGVEFERLQGEALEKRIQKVKVFARVAPVHKLKIVEVLQKQGEVVAMTGDGVNDGPALKKADIGVAMGSGTEVAQQTSSIVLLDDNFETIVAAVEEGRRIFDNIRKVVLILLSDAFAEIILIFGSLLLGLPLPILPAQILWINLIDDSPPSLALAFDPAEKEIMVEPPRRKKEAILNFEVGILIVIISLLTGIGTLALFYYLYVIKGEPLSEARSVCFTLLAVDTLIYVFSTRSLRHSIFREKFFSNKYLPLALAAGFILQILAVYFPPLQKIFKTTALTFTDWLIVIGVSLLWVLVIEVTKWIFSARRKKRS